MFIRDSVRSPQAIPNVLRLTCAPTSSSLALTRARQVEALVRWTPLRDALILKLNDKGLADATVQRIFTVLRVALSGAVRDGLVARNPASSVKQPSCRQEGDASPLVGRGHPRARRREGLTVSLPARTHRRNGPQRR